MVVVVVGTEDLHEDEADDFGFTGASLSRSGSHNSGQGAAETRGGNSSPFGICLHEDEAAIAAAIAAASQRLHSESTILVPQLQKSFMQSLMPPPQTEAGASFSRSESHNSSQGTAGNSSPFGTCLLSPSLRSSPVRTTPELLSSCLRGSTTTLQWRMDMPWCLPFKLTCVSPRWSLARVLCEKKKALTDPLPPPSANQVFRQQKRLNLQLHKLIPLQLLCNRHDFAPSGSRQGINEAPVALREEEYAVRNPTSTSPHHPFPLDSLPALPCPNKARILHRHDTAA